MQTIQVVLDDDLLTATDRAAQKKKFNRSAFVREALQEHLKKSHYQDLERRDREGYERYPDTIPDDNVWEGVAAWPRD